MSNIFECLWIVEASYLGQFTIQLTFNDRKKKRVDFRPFLEKSSHPDVLKYGNEKAFTEFKVIDGNLNWNDYEMIFPIWDLYSGQIS